MTVKMYIFVQTCDDRILCSHDITVMSKVAKKIGFMLPGGYILGIKKRNKYFGSLKECFVTQVCGVTELSIHVYYESNIHRTLTFNVYKQNKRSQVP